MTTKRSRRVVSVALSAAALFALSGYSSCDPVLENSGFDLWCGDELCYWKLEQGQIRKAPTWHSSDYGVLFDGEYVRLSQKTDNVPDCILMNLVADIETTAEVWIVIETDDGESYQTRQGVPSTHWGVYDYLFDLPPLYGTATVSIEKRGTGRAVLAQLKAEQGEGCRTGYGELCSPGECAEGVCAPYFNDDTSIGGFGTCGTCEDHSDCASDLPCGLDAPLYGRAYEMHAQCGEPGRHGLGERCIYDEECATGICSQGTCGTCRGIPSNFPMQDTCDDGQVCDVAAIGVPFATMMCNPGMGQYGVGEHCLTAADCASGSCIGSAALRVCEQDGRRCEEDADCPADYECLEVGIAGGACQ